MDLTANLNLAQELLLLVMDEDSGEATVVPSRTMGYALAAAALIELELQHRIDTSPEELIVADPTPLGDDLLDPVLADIVEVSREAPRNAEFWIRRMAARSEELRARVLAGLATHGLVEADDTGFSRSLDWRRGLGATRMPAVVKLRKFGFGFCRRFSAPRFPTHGT